MNRYLIALVLSLPVHTGRPPGKRVFIQPAPVYVPPSSLTLYKPTGEKIAFCKLNGGILTECELEKGFTLDDLMNAWLDAYANKEKLESEANQ